MLSRYIIELRHTPKDKHGNLVKTYIKLNALNPQNAMRRAVLELEESYLETGIKPHVQKIDVACDPWPVNKKNRYKALKEFEQDVSKERWIHALNRLISTSSQ